MTKIFRFSTICQTTGLTSNDLITHYASLSRISTLLHYKNVMDIEKGARITFGIILAIFVVAILVMSIYDLVAKYLRRKIERKRNRYPHANFLFLPNLPYPDFILLIVLSDRSGLSFQSIYLNQNRQYSQ